MMIAGCSSSPDAIGAETELVSSTTIVTTTTRALAPEIRVPQEVRAEIGRTFSDAIVVIDPNGDEPTVDIQDDLPEGFSVTENQRGRITGFEWKPTEPGEWNIEITATDPGGLRAMETLRVVGRNPRPKDLLLAMGDSVAAGFGRDRSDLVGGDECSRSEGDAYGPRAAAGLIEAGELDPDADVVVVACAAADAQSLRVRAVLATDAEGDVIGAALSQLDWATLLNPTFVTLTVGAADVQLFDIEEFLRADAGEVASLAVDGPLLELRLEHVERTLAFILDELVQTTDAHIAMTTYYDPTAGVPVGIDGCGSVCMVDSLQLIVTSLNATIERSVDGQPADRVTLVRLDGSADVFEAGNGIGPDALREGLGPFQRFIDAFTGGSFALCAREGEPILDLISSLDCAHPNEDGHRAIADLVLEELLSQ
jgi:hypothetical protein